jgi:23S rRNA pseudouridine1911/1915/1917 synthase
MESMLKTYIVSPESRGMRLDVYLTAHNASLTRSHIKRLIESENVKLNGGIPKAGEMLKQGDRIDLTIPPPEPLQALPEPIPVNIVHEDADVIVINKPAGLVVHPAAGHYSGTLVNGLLYHCKTLSSFGEPFRPGIVHRLDKNTSGVMVVAKNDYSHQHLAAQFKAHSVTKEYRGFVVGVMEENKGTVSSLIGRHPKDPKRMSVQQHRGKMAITHWEIFKRYPPFTFLSIKLETGRTHQIRVHLANMHHPVLCDPEYGGRKTIAYLPDPDLRQLLASIKRQLLHASAIGFIHPRREDYVEFCVPLPEDFQLLLHKLEEQ